MMMITGWDSCCDFVLARILRARRVDRRRLGQSYLPDFCRFVSEIRRSVSIVPVYRWRDCSDPPYPFLFVHTQWERKIFSVSGVILATHGGIHLSAAPFSIFSHSLTQRAATLLARTNARIGSLLFLVQIFGLWFLFPPMRVFLFLFF